MIEQKSMSAYTLHLPQHTYLVLKLYAAREGVRLGHHITINEIITEFIRVGLEKSTDLVTAAWAGATVVP